MRLNGTIWENLKVRGTKDLGWNPGQQLHVDGGGGSHEGQNKNSHRGTKGTRTVSCYEIQKKKEESSSIKWHWKVSKTRVPEKTLLNALLKNPKFSFPYFPYQLSLSKERVIERYLKVLFQKHPVININFNHMTLNLLFFISILQKLQRGGTKKISKLHCCM